MSEADLPRASEIPVFFPADGETLFGILTTPADEAAGTAVIVLPGGSTPLTTDRNRISVRLCRRVASQGYHAMRLDYHGAGESTGSLGWLRLDRPFADDVQGAVRWIERQGVRSTVLVGSCFGARTALSAAPETAGIRGVVLVSVPVRDHAMGARASNDAALEWSLWTYLKRTLNLRVIRGLFDRRHRHVYQKYARAKLRKVSARLSRRNHRRSADAPDGLGLASPHFLTPLASLVERGVPVLFVFGTSEGHRKEFDRAMAGRLGEIVQRAGPSIEVEMLPGRVHGFRSSVLQDAVIDVIGNWLGRLDAPTSSAEDRTTRPVAGAAGTG
jgi:alpha/beta superfamily hydrolase